MQEKIKRAGLCPATRWGRRAEGAPIQITGGPAGRQPQTLDTFSPCLNQIVMPVKSDIGAVGYGIKKINLFIVILALAGLAVPAHCWAQCNPLNPGSSYHIGESALKSDLTQLQEVKTKVGVNNVFFKGVGLPAQITVASEYGFTDFVREVYFINIQDTDVGWTVAHSGANNDETITDEFDDGYYSESVRFINATFCGLPESYLFVAKLDGAYIPSSLPTTATISVEQLQPSVTHGFDFLPILQFQTTAKYDDADEALLKEFGIPMPIGYKPEPGE